MHVHVQVAGALMALPGKQAWMVLGQAAAAAYGQGAIDFYVKRGLFAKVCGAASCTRC